MLYENVKMELLRRHLRDAEHGLLENTPQIADRARASIPTIGLEEERDELVSAQTSFRPD
jgi:hypothetical protein